MIKMLTISLLLLFAAVALLPIVAYGKPKVSEGDILYAYVICNEELIVKSLVKVAHDKLPYFAMLTDAIGHSVCFAVDAGNNVYVKKKIAEGTYYNGDIIQAWSLRARKGYNFFGLFLFRKVEKGKDT